MRQGPLRLGLRQPRGSRHQADGPRHDRGSVARGQLGRGHRLHRDPLPGDRGAVRRERDRRHHVIALHERGGLPRPEDGPRGVRHEQRRHLRPGLPLADRLRPQDDLRDVGRDAGLRVGRQGGRHRRHRRQPDGRSPGLRLADEASAARGREAHRHRPAPDRPRPQPAHRGEPPPPAPARDERRGHQRDGPRRRHRRADGPGVRRRALRGRRRMGRVHRPAGEQPRGDGADHERSRRGTARRRSPVRHGPERRDLLRPRRHRAQPGLDDGHGHGQPRHGDRQHRARGRRRQPAAWPEQRPGLVRHGLVPARAVRLPARVGSDRPRAVRRPVGRADPPGAGPAHPEHAELRDRRHVPRASTSRARTSPSRTRTPSTSPPR